VTGPDARHKFALLILLLFLTTVSAARAQRGEDTAPVHFSISSRGTGFGVQADYEGTYLNRADRIEVRVTKVTFYVSDHCPYKGSRTIDHVRFGLGVETGRVAEWKIESASEPVLVGLQLNPKEEYTLYDQNFSIPKSEGVDLSKRWLVAEIQTQAVDAPAYERTGLAYTSSCKDFFLPAGTARRSRDGARQTAKNF
jgi:hypothetical protein